MLPHFHPFLSFGGDLTTSTLTTQESPLVFFSRCVQTPPLSEQKDVLFPSNFGTLVLLSQGGGGGGGTMGPVRNTPFEGGRWSHHQLSCRVEHPIAWQRQRLEGERTAHPQR